MCTLPVCSKLVAVQPVAELRSLTQQTSSKSALQRASTSPPLAVVLAGLPGVCPQRAPRVPGCLPPPGQAGGASQLLQVRLAHHAAAARAPGCQLALACWSPSCPCLIHSQRLDAGSCLVLHLPSLAGADASLLPGLQCPPAAQLHGGAAPRRRVRRPGRRVPAAAGRRDRFPRHAGGRVGHRVGRPALSAGGRVSLRLQECGRSMLAVACHSGLACWKAKRAAAAAVHVLCELLSCECSNLQPPDATSHRLPCCHAGTCGSGSWFSRCLLVRPGTRRCGSFATASLRAWASTTASRQTAG